MIYFTIPSTLKYKKMHKLKMPLNKNIYNNVGLCYGEYGIIALETAFINVKQINSLRKVLLKLLKKQGTLLVRFSPNFCFSAKPAETRMGKGKGSPEGFVKVVRPGLIMFEMVGVSEALAKEAMRLATHKLPFATRFVRREDQL